MNALMDNSPAAWADYTSAFVQRIPRYCVKIPGRTWRTKSKPLTDRPIQAHLAGTYAVAVLGQAYPLYGILDVDDRARDEVERVRDILGMDAGTSMVMNSESPDSYHVIFKPEYNGRPPSIRLLGEIFRDFARTHRLELYPRWRHAIRLPFGPKQTPADPEYRGLETWEDMILWYGKLDAYDLKSVQFAQGSLNLPMIGPRPAVPKVGQSAAELFEHGLQAPGTRYGAQFTLLLSLWRGNVPQEQGESVVWNWIRKKHNGFSRDILRHPESVRKEITRQAVRVWGHYDFSHVLPDVPALHHEGYVSKPDILEIIRATKGNLPRSRFLHGLVHFMNPRRYRLSVGVSKNRLIAWGNERTYLRYLSELSELGIVRRGSSYLVGAFSKPISMTWPWTSSKDAILHDGRSVEGFDGAVKRVLRPGEFREALSAQGAKRTTVIEAARIIFGGFTGEVTVGLGPRRNQQAKSLHERGEGRGREESR